MRFQVLGPLEVATADGPLTIRAKRPRALLAILLLNATDVVSIDRIIDGIWPGQPPRSALENVRTYVFQLRSLFAKADPALTGRPAGNKARLESHPAGYRIRTDPEELDLLRFTSLAANGNRALQLGDYASAAMLLGEAIELWKGAPFPELVLGSAIRAKIVALEERRWQVQTDWIRARLALGHRAELVPLLQEMIGERPFDENLRHLLMTALYEMGRTGEALAAFADARHTLVRELGVDPGPELRRAQAAMLSGDVLTTAGPAAPTVEQYPRIPHHLPATGADLVGRDAELDAIAGLADAAEPQPAARAKVALVTGAPGIGKTATALAAAARVSRSFPQGQLYVNLGGSTDQPLTVDDAVAALLSGLGIAPQTIAEPGARCRSLYRSLLAERQMLVVLDDAVDAAQVSPLIPGSGRSLVIVTSRRFLAGVGCDVRLKPELLSDEDGLRLLRRTVGADRVTAEPAAALSIVRACGGLPSAVEIAGARLAALPGHPLQYLAERLAERDRVLEELSLDGLSLTELFASSYGSLDARAQRCFRALGMFDPDHITAEKLAEPLELPVRSADRQLERLVHEGLLRPARADQGGPRYCMPTVLHAYARTRLSIEGAEVNV